MADDHPAPSPEPPEEAAERFAAQIEEVRAWLVIVRGGAPFLSAPDSRLLLAWLEAGVSVPLILSAIDRVALRRRRRRTRSRLTLTACKGEVKKLLGAEPTTPPAASGGATATGLTDLAAKVEAMPCSPEVGPARAELARDLARLAHEPLDRDALANQAIAALRRFHDAVWELADQQALLAQARQELEPLRIAVSESVFDDLAAETARDCLRRLHPLVSAQVVWDSLNGP